MIEEVPTKTQLLFARAVILTMELWPAMRLAVSEQWGGVESADKKQFLISHICDTYSEERSVSSVQQQQQQQQQHSIQSSTSTTATIQAPKVPDVDDLAETLEMYFEDEYESKIEDGSADWIAGRIVHLHKCIYSTFPPTQKSLEEAEKEVNKLYEATVRLKGQKVEIQRTQQENGDEQHGSCDSSDDDDHEHDDDDMDVDGESSTQQQPQQQQQRQERMQPVVDEDGFTTVVKGRRR